MLPFGVTNLKKPIISPKIIHTIKIFRRTVGPNTSLEKVLLRTARKRSKHIQNVWKRDVVTPNSNKLITNAQAYLDTGAVSSHRLTIITANPAIPVIISLKLNESIIDSRFLVFLYLSRHMKTITNPLDMIIYVEIIVAKIKKTGLIASLRSVSTNVLLLFVVEF